MMIERIFIIWALLYTAVCPVCAEQQVMTTDITQAKSHYLAGEEAFNRGLILTAVVEWETVMVLKPSSEYTAKRLAQARKLLTPQLAQAYNLYINAKELENAGSFNSAQSELRAAYELCDIIPTIFIEMMERLKTADKQQIKQNIVISSQENTIPNYAFQASAIDSRNEGTPKGLQIISCALVNDTRPSKRPYVDGKTFVGAFVKCAKGQIKNASQFRYNKVCVTIGFYDERGIKVDSDMIRTETLAPGEIWEFLSEKTYEIMLPSQSTAAAMIPSQKKPLPKPRIDKIEATQSKSQGNSPEIIIH